MLMSLFTMTWPERLGRTVQRWALAWGRIFYLGAVVLVLVLSPSSYGPVSRRTLARHIYLDTAPVLIGLTALAALLCVVVTRIVVVAAILRAGFCVVNVNPLYTPDELSHQLKDSGAKAIFLLDNFANTLQKALPHTPELKHIVVRLSLIPI